MPIKFKNFLLLPYVNFFIFYLTNCMANDVEELICCGVNSIWVSVEACFGIIGDCDGCDRCCTSGGDISSICDFLTWPLNIAKAIWNFNCQILECIWNFNCQVLECIWDFNCQILECNYNWRISKCISFCDIACLNDYFNCCCKSDRISSNTNNTCAANVDKNTSDFNSVVTDQPIEIEILEINGKDTSFKSYKHSSEVNPDISDKYVVIEQPTRTESMIPDAKNIFFETSKFIVEAPLDINDDDVVTEQPSNVISLTVDNTKEFFETSKLLDEASPNINDDSVVEQATRTKSHVVNTIVYDI